MAYIASEWNVRGGQLTSCGFNISLLPPHCEVYELFGGENETAGAKEV